MLPAKETAQTFELQMEDTKLKQVQKHYYQGSPLTGVKCDINMLGNRRICMPKCNVSVERQENFHKDKIKTTEKLSNICTPI